MISLSGRDRTDDGPLASVADLVSLLRLRAISHSDDTTYVFLGDGENESARLSFAELDRRARMIAVRLQDQVAEGERALLLYPPGLDYIEAFFACLYAGVVAVPAYPPSGRHLQRLRSIYADADPAVIMTTKALFEPFAADAEAKLGAGRLQWITTDGLVADADDWRPIAITPERLAFLQYTSGSTRDPRGVMVSHGNLLANQALIKESFGHNESSTLVGWLPFYHDMGLIGNIIQPLYVGATAILMSPMAFLERPIRWLQAISKYRAHTSGGPNFAFDLCARKIDEAEKIGLDLSCWRIAFSGAEPVRAATLARFASQFRGYGFDSDSFYPCYGLAEATLVVTAPSARRVPTIRTIDRSALEENRISNGDAEDSVSLIGCGRVWPEHHLAIVDPDTGTRRVEGLVGEVWVAGPSVTQGYWRQPAATESTFHALLAGRSTERFLRTGDLGFLEAGELYITGRMKDIIIIAGRNYYPQDFETAVEDNIEEIRPGCCAAFATQAEEHEMLVLVVEPQRGQLALLRESGPQALVRKIREAVTDECRVAPAEIILVQPGSIPKTSSGKIRRAECRRAYLDGSLRIVATADHISESRDGGRNLSPMSQTNDAEDLLHAALSLLPIPQKAALVTRFLLSTAARLLRTSESELDANASILRSGLDSLRAVELKHAIDSFLRADVPVALVLSDISFAALAKKLVVTTFGAPSVSEVASGDRAPSFTQRAMWTVHQLHPASAAYNLHLALKIAGPLDEATLRASFEDILTRHDALRTVYGTENGELVTSTCPLDSLDGWLSVVDAREWSNDALGADMTLAAAMPFDLESGPALRARLYRGHDGERTLLLCAHHIALDLWSLLIVLNELQIAYSARRDGGEDLLPKLSDSYNDFAAWQQRYIESSTGAQDWEYWRQRLEGDLPVLALPLDHPRGSAHRYEGSSLCRSLDTRMTAAARNVAQNNGVTLFVLLLAVYEIVLYRYTHQRDLIIGTASSGRNQGRFKGIVGNFVNPLALRTRIAPATPVSLFLQEIQHCVRDALARQDFPFSEIVERLRPERVEGRWPIFQTWFAFQQAQSDVDAGYAQLALGEDTDFLPWGELEIAGVGLVDRIERFDLKLMAAEVRDGITLSFQYRRDLLEATTIARFADYYEFVLCAVLENPEKAIGAFALEPAPRELIAADVEARREPESNKLLLIHEQVAEWALATPRATAIAAGDETATYAELDARANRMAWLLRQEGVGRNVCVAVCATRSVETIVAILAILKAGGAYLPFDPGVPPLRLATMLADADARAVLCRKGWLERSALEFDGAVVLFDDAPALGAFPDTAPEGDVALADLAYVIFTSGSSGTAKGVAVTHGSLSNYTQAMLARIDDGSRMRFALASTLAADLGHTVVFPSLASGGCLHLLREEEATDPRAFEAYLIGRAIDVLKIVPSHYNALLSPVGDRTPTPRKTLIFGGEALPTQLAKRVAEASPACRLFNHYGPTETTVGALVLLLTPVELGAAKANAPIGRTIDNVNVHILNQDGMPTPYGVSGEICLSGAGVARGYIGRPDLTAERFLPNPFGSPGERLYRTGDLGVIDDHGIVTFLGRIDQQIKLRGHRVELGEIEARMNEHPDIGQAVVTPVASGTQTRLAAYFVAKCGVAPSPDLLRAYLARILPDYMIPASFVVLDALPITVNGKVARHRLPAPVEVVASFGVCRSPRNIVEERLARIYAEVLGIERIGIDDNFFSVGGDSITSIQVASRAHAVGLSITPGQIFRHQSIAELSEAIDAPEPTATPAYPPTDGTIGSAHIPDLDLRRLESLGVTPSQIEDVYPATPLQAGLLFHTLSEPNSGVYVMQHRYWIEGSIDIDAFRRAWQAIADAHPIFRTSFAWDGLPIPHQVVHRHVELPFEYADWRAFSEGERQERLDDLLADERAKGFELGRAPLIRSRLFRLEDRRYLLIRSHHHILFDAWCTSPILDELRSNYDALVEERAPPKRIHVGFRDYIAWLQRRDAAAAEPFWRDYLQGFDEPTPFFPHRSSGLSSGGVEDATCLLSREVTDALDQAARRLRVTANTFAQAALALLLARYTNRKDIVFGVTVSGRPADLPHVESILGLFINALPLRLLIEPDRPLPALLECVLADNYAIRDYEYVSLTQIREWSEIPAGTDMFQYLLTFENAPVDSRLSKPCGDWRFTESWHRTHTNYPITFVVIPGPRLHLQVTYARDRVDAEVAERLLDHYRRILEEMIRRPDARLGEFDMLAEDERTQLVEQWNQTYHRYAEPQDILGRFERQAQLRPNSVAASCDGATLTYDELARRARAVAAGLIRNGVGPDDLVALLDYRGLDFLVLMLGVFHSGAGYLPLDPAYPDGRIIQILVEAKVSRLSVGRSLRQRAESIVSGASEHGIEILNIASLEEHEETFFGRSPRHSPNGLAFVIFTSGSTGKPKGAAVEHRGMFNNLITKEQALGLTSDDVIAQTASQCFDISVWQFLTALMLGARIEIFPDDISRDPVRLLDEIDSRGVTIFETVPSMIRALLDASDDHRRLRRLRWLLPCGEAFAPELCRLFMQRFPHVGLLNAYGPAECSDDVSYYPIETAPEGDELSVPIGSPVDNTQLYVVDRWLEPTPVGVAGEICVAGIQVGRGYLYRPDLTAASFLPDPFGEIGGRLYRTGDLGRRRRDGVIDFLGRIDHQVKIRGNRIEPGEIEARLASHPDVRAACVLVREMSRGAHGLIAYVESAAERFASEDLRRHIRAALPDYMIPEAFVRLDALPLSPNGKVDRKALPAPVLDASMSSWRVAPRNPTEETIAQIWMDLLNAPQVSVNDNFFDLGGHSLLAARIASRIRSIFAIALPLRELLEASNLADLAARVDEARSRSSASSPAPIVRARRDMSIPLSNAQQRLWFMHHRDPFSSAYHFTVAVRAFGPLDDDLFEAALNAIVQRHETLRTVFAIENGRVVQRVLPELTVRVHRAIIDGSIEVEGAADRAMTDLAVAPFDLERGPLVRCALFRPSAGGDAVPSTAVLLCFHHIIFDGWSFTVFLREFAATYSAIRASREASLPPLQIQYADYVVWHAEQLRGDDAATQLSYWREHLRGAPSRLDLPMDRPRSSAAGYAAGSHVIDLTDLQQSFDAFNRARAVTPFMTILSAFAMLLRYLSGSSDLVIGTDVANRPRVELESMIGFFVNLVALRVRLNGDPSFEEVVERVRGVTLSAYDNQTFPFDKLVEALRPERDAGYSPIFQVKVAFHNVPTPEFDVAELRFDEMSLESSHGELDLVLHVYQRRQGMRVVFEYRAALFNAATIVFYAELFRILLRASLERPDIRLGAVLEIIAERDKAIRDAARSEQLAARRARLHHIERRNLLL